MFICIYRIANKINGKTYIGQHKYKSLNDSYFGSGVLIMKAIKKYGKENFSKDILYSRIQRQDTADELETITIKRERQLGKAEYNIANGGLGHSCTSWNKGKKLTEEQKKKHKETCASIEFRSKMSKLGRKKKEPHSAEWKAENSRRMKEQYSSGNRCVSTAFLEKACTNAIGRKWYTDSKVDRMLFECPIGWFEGRSQYDKNKSDSSTR